VLDHHAAARAVRRAVHVIPRVLRHVERRRVRGIDRRRVAVADGHAADRGRGVEIRLEQRRRERLRVGDVSKFALLVSSGSQLPASTSSASRSLIERAYSGRLSRWNVRTPGLGLALAAVSICVSSVLISAA